MVAEVTASVKAACKGKIQGFEVGRLGARTPHPHPTRLPGRRGGIPPALGCFGVDASQARERVLWGRGEGCDRTCTDRLGGAGRFRHCCFRCACTLSSSTP